MLGMTTDDLLALIGDWEDPNPPLVVREYKTELGFYVYVVRDDLLGVGSKVRALDYLIGTLFKNKTEIVYGSSPATGYAQISLPYVCSQYFKTATIFMAERGMDKLHPFQIKGLSLGGNYVWVPNGMLAVTEKKARDYASQDPKRALMPIGLDHPTVIASFIKVARSLGYTPGSVWSVGSSGTLNRSLQLAWPDSEVHVVQVGHNMKKAEIGRAIHHTCSYKFDKPVHRDDAPPYPSVPEYDAKLWTVMMDYYKSNRNKIKEPILIWNVA